MGRVYVNNYASSLNGAITVGGLSIVVNSATGLPTLTGTQYCYLTIGGSGSQEIVKVTAIAGTTLTVVRAQESTTAVAWASGTPIRMNFTAASLATVTAPTENALASWDGNSNLSANNALEGYQTIATAAGTTVFTVTTPKQTFFTGSTTQTVTLPVASTLALGQSFDIVNNSTGTVTINSSGSNLVYSLLTLTKITVTCILTSGTTAASWSATSYPGSATDANAFSTIHVAGQTDITAGSTSAAFTLAAGSNITLTTSGSTATIAASGGSATLYPYTTTATAGGTTTLTVSSNYLQVFTGVTTQIVVMPDVTTLTLGQSWEIYNLSTGAVTVRSSGSNTIIAVPAKSEALVTCNALTGTTATSWNYAVSPVSNTTSGTGDTVRATSPTLVTPDIGTPSAGILTSCTGLPVAGGGTGRSTMTAYGLLLGGTTSTGTMQTMAVGTSKQFLMSQGASSLPAWSNVSIFTTDVTGTTQTCASNTAYIADNVAQVVFTLPATGTPSVGDFVQIIGLNSGGWKLTANTGQVVNVGSSPTTSAGSVASANRYDCIRVVYVAANTWVMTSSVTAGFTIT